MPDSDVYKRQILTSRVDARTERVNPSTHEMLTKYGVSFGPKVKLGHRVVFTGDRAIKTSSAYCSGDKVYGAVRRVTQYCTI